MDSISRLYASLPESEKVEFVAQMLIDEFMATDHAPPEADDDMWKEARKSARNIINKTRENHAQDS